MLLMDLVLRLGRFRQGRRVVFFHLSALSHTYRQPSYQRIAFEQLTALSHIVDGQVIQLENGDLFILTRGALPSNLEALAQRVKNLFRYDPLLDKPDVFDHINPHFEKAGFCTYYDLEKEGDYDALVDHVRLLVEKLRPLKQEEPPKEKTKKNRWPSPSDDTGETFSLAPGELSKLEQALATMDMTSLVRRQKVCTLAQGAKPQPVFEEIYTSIANLQHFVMPHFDLSRNPWLFRYLTHTLDRRLMRMLLRDGLEGQRPFSLNLNVATVLTPDFSAFEAAVPPTLRGRLVIELHFLDVFSDMSAFLFVRDYLHDHGFRFCLDGVTLLTLPYCDREKLGFDFVKLGWVEDLFEDMSMVMRGSLQHFVSTSGLAYTILCHCDNEKALAFGADAGIVLFQGRAVDKLLNG